MLYNEACGEKLSRLGFGCMRLPLKKDKSIDEGELQRMVDYAIEYGINYFDMHSAAPGGHSCGLRTATGRSQNGQLAVQTAT